MARILIIDDHDSLREGMAVVLKKNGIEVAAVRSGTEGVAAYKKSAFDMVITDLKMDRMDGLEVVKQLRAHDPDCVVMVVTAFGTIETAVAAMQQGACDFITKPFAPDVLRAKVDQGLQIAGTRKQLQRLIAHNEVLSQQAAAAVGSLVGSSEPMQKLVSLIRKAAQSETTVLVVGESGTGKELVARMIHDLSPRKAGPFVAVHCAALAETLLESELFGHERGSFTGAVRRKLGRFELADMGTLFLDEVGEIPMSVQTKLLRAIQEKEIQRVGSEETLGIDVRVVSATHRDLKAEVARGSFREDLYYRLHVVPLHIPPLRERPEDIPQLASYFVLKSAAKMNPAVKGLTDGAMRALARYAWPGNVRELENVIEQSLVFAEHSLIDEGDLPQFLQGPQAQRPPASSIPIPRGDRPLPEILEDVERQLVEQAYEKAGRVKTETARLLGIKTSALYYKLEKYGFIRKGDAPERGDG
ncbi:MAG TPA: sigma-54 dependent transcriptional regulator [Myxococcaceae bacterium]|nr:sigma-54 dependent transcriptional regulator [Myxococcaceae bacterium]